MQSIWSSFKFLQNMYFHEHFETPLYVCNIYYVLAQFQVVEIYHEQKLLHIHN